MNRIQLGFNIVFLAILIGGFLLLKKDRDFRQHNEQENFEKLQRIEQNMRYIQTVSIQIDSVLKADSQQRLMELTTIQKSNNFVNKIPHLSDDTLSIYYKNSWDYLLSRHRAGTLRPTTGE